MKTQISRISHDPSKRYSAIHQQQGRMITDADWNELQDIVKHRIEEVVRDLVGDGTPAHRGLQIDIDDTQTDARKKVRITAGRIYAGGVAAATEAAHLASPTTYTYGNQKDFPQAPGVPTVGDVLYADIWEREVTHLDDPALRDEGLLGADTCTRMQTLVQIKLWRPADPSQGEDPTSTPLLNPAIGNAKLTLKLRDGAAGGGPDAASVDRSTDNYLFRVEVHEVKGPPNAPTELTLKWSHENGAEAFPLTDVPSDFRSGEHACVYEFYKADSDLNLGVHCAKFQPPKRPILTAQYIAPGEATHVRRWDGSCKLTFQNSTWTCSEGTDRGIPLIQSHNPSDPLNAHGDVSTAGGNLQILLQTIHLHLTLPKNLTNSSFVAGDYWVAPVRENASTNTPLLDAGQPAGIVHRHLNLGKLVSAAGVTMKFEPAPELAFPTLADLKAHSTTSAHASMIKASPVVDSPYSLNGMNVDAQLSELLTHLNDHIYQPVPAVRHNASQITAETISDQPYELQQTNVAGQLAELLALLKKLNQDLGDFKGALASLTGATLVGNNSITDPTFGTISGGSLNVQLKGILDAIATHSLSKAGEVSITLAPTIDADVTVGDGLFEGISDVIVVQWQLGNGQHGSMLNVWNQASVPWLKVEYIGTNQDGLYKKWWTSGKFRRYKTVENINDKIVTVKMSGYRIQR